MSKYVSLDLDKAAYSATFKCKHKNKTKNDVYRKIMSFGIWRLFENYTCTDCDHKWTEKTNVFKYDRRDKKTHKLNIIKEEWQK